MCLASSKFDIYRYAGLFTFVCCADLERKGPLPEGMLDMMQLLERESAPFCRKRLITVSGHDRGLVYSANADMTLLDAIRCPVWLL